MKPTIVDITDALIDFMNKSVTLQATDATKLLISLGFSEWLAAHYEIKPKESWYGIDLDKKIKDLRQQLAIAYNYKKKEKTCILKTRKNSSVVNHSSQLQMSLF